MSNILKYAQLFKEAEKLSSKVDVIKFNYKFNKQRRDLSVHPLLSGTRICDVSPGGVVIGVYQRAAMRTIHLVKQNTAPTSLKYSKQVITKKVIKIPPLLYLMFAIPTKNKSITGNTVLVKPGLCVYAINGPINSLDDPLFVAPLFNTSVAGRMCLGVTPTHMPLRQENVIAESLISSIWETTFNWEQSQAIQLYQAHNHPIYGDATLSTWEQASVENPQQFDTPNFDPQCPFRSPVKSVRWAVQLLRNYSKK